MKKLDAKQLIFVKKCIGAGCVFVCLLLMLFKVFNYTSSSTIANGEAITWSEGFSLYNFLFNGDLFVLEYNVNYLREVFVYSHVIMWIGFILLVLALGISIYGIFNKKNIFSKIGSITLLAVMALFITISFDSHRVSSITVKYISVFNVFYIMALIVSVIGAFSTLTIKDK